MIILIWGTGRLVGKLLGKYMEVDSVTAFIDNDNSKTEYMGKKVLLPEMVTKMKYDAIIVANLYRKEIQEQCKSLNIDLSKVIFLYNNNILEDVNKDYDFVAQILGEDYAKIVKNRYHVIRGVESYGDLFLKDLDVEYIDDDYVRLKCFELAVKELRKQNVKGSVAELGVFRGEFAQYINMAFPDRKCYLFDTFEGFDANEALNEVKKGNCTDAFINAYKQTDINIVLEKMQYPENLIIKQGFFPASINGLEDRFAFVSIDVDFEESIYQALQYFYPRLNEGGYLFVHDYNSSLMGVEKAVIRYEEDMNVRLCKMPLCDANGTLVITK